MIELLVITNALRWWGCIAGVICLADFFKHIEVIRNDRLVYHRMGTGLIAVFLILMGFVIPLSTHGVSYFIADSLIFNLILLIGWTAISLAGWMSVFKYSINVPHMKRVAALTLGVMLYASWMI